LEKDRKKKVMFIVVAVICLTAAATIIYFSFGSGSKKRGLGSLESGVMFWMQCTNCGKEWQIDRKDYYKFTQLDPMLMVVPGMQCPGCGQEAGYLAHKCPKCGDMFFDHACGPRDFGDRCPKCKYSEIEDARKKRAKN
jgi:hypothetical protein